MTVTEKMIEAAVEEVRRAKGRAVWDRWTDHEAVSAMLSAALAAAEPSEPVAWMYPDHVKQYIAGNPDGIAWAHHKQSDHYSVPLYLHPTPAPADRGAVERAYKDGYRIGAGSYIGAPDSEEDMRIAQQQSWDMHRGDYDAALALPAAEVVKEPRAWFVKDYADGWIHFDNEADALRQVEATGAMMYVGYHAAACAPHTGKDAKAEFAAWIERGPALAKKAGCYVGIKVSALAAPSQAREGGR